MKTTKEMAHDYAIEMLKRGDPEHRIASDAWALADKMKAIADDREKKKAIADAESIKEFMDVLRKRP